MKINKEKTKEILQNEWGSARFDDELNILATTKIVYCTGFYGYDELNEIGFLCHFDLPWSTGSLPCFFSSLQKHIPKERKIKAFLVGGWSFMWSRGTRENVRNYICQLNNCGWNIKLIENEYNNKRLSFIKTGWGEAIQMDVATGEVTPYSNTPLIRKKGRTFYNTAIRFNARCVDEQSN